MSRAENLKNILLGNAMWKLEKYLADRKGGEGFEKKFIQMLMEKANCCK